MKIVGAAVENDVHIAGLVNFFRLAQDLGNSTINLGVAVPLGKLLEEAQKEKADIIAISYRLSPESAQNIFSELKKEIEELNLKDKIFIFGGTPPNAELAEKTGLFAQIFKGGESPEEIRSFLKGERLSKAQTIPPQTLEERIRYRQPYPLIRHHFGLPDLEKTVEGVKMIAEAQLVDIISLGPDQNAQESFFRPQEMDHHLNGAGGVPLRSEKDLERIYEASRCGNYPLLRCYAGTRDLLRWAELTKSTINNCFGAVPIFWYSQLDGRSQRPLREAIEENLEVMRWYAQEGIPLEINDPHQWSLRYAPDAVAVADAYLAAQIAKILDVSVYVQQYMFNTPPEITAIGDLGKMLAQMELIESLREENFRPIHMVRAGLAHFSPDLNIAKGQLASSTVISLELHPQIIHVVGFSEGDHAVTPEELIESVKIVQGVLRNLQQGSPEMSLDEMVKRRKEEIIREALYLFHSILSLAGGSISTILNKEILAQVVERGIFDAPHLMGSKVAKGEVLVTLKDGCCRSMDPQRGEAISEEERLKKLGF